VQKHKHRRKVERAKYKARRARALARPLASVWRFSAFLAKAKAGAIKHAVPVPPSKTINENSGLRPAIKSKKIKNTNTKHAHVHGDRDEQWCCRFRSNSLVFTPPPVLGASIPAVLACAMHLYTIREKRKGDQKQRKQILQKKVMSKAFNQNFVFSGSEKRTWCFLAFLVKGSSKTPQKNKQKNKRLLSYRWE
jgi:hypothetical protein